MRKDPTIPFSDAYALIQWPSPGVSQVATVAIFYGDQDQLLRDYKRTAQWFPVSGAKSSVCSLYLEKTQAGQAWLDFGRRHYMRLGRRTKNGRSKVRVVESIRDRIAVSIPFGANSRSSVARKVKASQTLWVIFANYEKDDPQGQEKAERYLRLGCLAAASETQPLLLAGISTLGKYTPTRWERCL